MPKTPATPRSFGEVSEIGPADPHVVLGRWYNLRGTIDPRHRSTHGSPTTLT